MINGVLVARAAVYAKSAPETSPRGAVRAFDCLTKRWKARIRGWAPSEERVVVRMAGMAKPEVAKMAPTGGLSASPSEYAVEGKFIPDKTPEVAMPSAAAARTPSK